MTIGEFVIGIIERFFNHIDEVRALNDKWHKAQVRDDPNRLWTLSCTSREGLLNKREHHAAHLTEIDRLLAA